MDAALSFSLPRVINFTYAVLQFELLGINISLVLLVSLWTFPIAHTFSREHEVVPFPADIQDVDPDCWHSEHRITMPQKSPEKLVHVSQ